MRINTQATVDVPNTMHCEPTGQRGRRCYRLLEEHGKHATRKMCSCFNEYLDEDKDGRAVKSLKCLAAMRLSLTRLPF